MLHTSAAQRLQASYVPKDDGDFEPVGIEIQRDAMIAAIEHMDPAQLQQQVVGLYRHGLMSASWCFARLKQAGLIGDIDDIIECYMYALVVMQEAREAEVASMDREGDFAPPEPSSPALEALASAREGRNHG